MEPQTGKKKVNRRTGIALMVSGIALMALPLILQPAMQGSISGASYVGTPGATMKVASPGGGNAVTFKTMSQNIVQASSGFQSLNPLNWFGGGGSISNNRLTKIDAQNLLMDSAETFDDGGSDAYYSPPPVVVARPNEQQPPAYYHDTGRDAFPAFTENGIKAVAAEPVSTFSIDVDTASYSFVRRALNEGSVPAADAIRLEELINYFPYHYALPSKEEDPFRPTVAVYPCPWQKDHKILHIGIKGYDVAEKPRSNLVFLIDTSGSMDSPDKLPLLVNSFKLLLDSLNPDDTVGIVTYAGSAGVALEPVPASHKREIIGVLDNLSAGGSTAGAAGLQAAYSLAQQSFLKEGNNRVILATDGDFNVGISGASDLVDFIGKKRGEGVFLSVLGFGTGNYHDNTMQALAQAGNGNAAYIDSLNEARKALVEEAGSTLLTIAKDVKVQVEFNPALVSEYRLIGYETRHLKREDFANDKVDAGEVGAGHAVTAIYEITPAGAPAAVSDLRYPPAPKAPAVQEKSAFSGEYAFLKIRYKRPDADKSVLTTRPVTKEDERAFDAQPDDIRFAAAVAGFGQLLRDSKYSGTLTWDQVISMADAARGKDEYGYRSEFVGLARLAKSVAGRGK